MLPSTVSQVDVSARRVPDGRVARAVGMLNRWEVEKCLKEVKGLDMNLEKFMR